MADRVVDPRFAERMRELIVERGLSYRAVAARTFYAKSRMYDLATGRKVPTVERATDLGADTLERLERVVDQLAVAYPSTPPTVLLPRVRRHVTFVRRLLDVRKTLEQHRRLLVVGGWLELLSATVHIDLGRRAVAATELVAAQEMADHAGHTEIAAWCLETSAWDLLTEGDYAEAIRLSQQAQALAPRGSSAFIQATAQEGKAWARIGQRRETSDALNRTTRLASPRPRPASASRIHGSCLR